jgi:hypothetical protein
VDDFIEQATHDFDTAMAGLESLEWEIRDALDELDRLTA